MSPNATRTGRRNHAEGVTRPAERRFSAYHVPQIALDPGLPITELVWVEHSPSAEIVDGAEIARAQLCLHALSSTPGMAVSSSMRTEVGFQGKPHEPLASMKFLDHTVDQVRTIVERCARLDWIDQRPSSTSNCSLLDGWHQRPRPAVGVADAA